MDSDQGNRLLKLKTRIVGTFTSDNWEELGLLTGASNVIDKHPRLLRSLAFGDQDYAGNALKVLRQIVEQNDKSLQVIEEYVAQHCPADSTYISAKPSERQITFAPHVFAVPDLQVEPDFVAVMMPFAAEFRNVYRSIAEATTACDLRCHRADDIWDEATIAQDIFNLIYRATIVIVDFTGKNPNVMYETGIAHTLGKHVIPISQSFDDVPFDMKHHRVLKYLPNAEGLNKLSGELKTKLMQSGIANSNVIDDWTF